ncbi:class I tRNA ligase family protein, partial [Elusimicrobiota bacterium]
MDKVKFITTPLYYVNARPHIGHSYTQIAADCLARYYRQRGKEVHFLTGTDEHGEKIALAASEKGVELEKFIDRGVDNFKQLWNTLDIHYDQFIRTTDEDHISTVQQVVKILQKKGLIYKDKYQGLYCVPCESFFTKSQAENNSCPDCGRELEELSQESYFFKLSAFKDRLIQHVENNDFVKPDYRKNEVLGFLKQDLKDLSISRVDVKWGIPFPGDEEHTVYVWFDALL